MNKQFSGKDKNKSTWLTLSVLRNKECADLAKIIVKEQFALTMLELSQLRMHPYPKEQKDQENVRKNTIERFKLQFINRGKLMRRIGCEELWNKEVLAFFGKNKSEIVSDTELVQLRKNLDDPKFVGDKTKLKKTIIEMDVINLLVLPVGVKETALIKKIDKILTPPNPKTVQQTFSQTTFLEKFHQITSKDKLDRLREMAHTSAELSRLPSQSVSDQMAILDLREQKDLNTEIGRLKGEKTDLVKDLKTC